MKNSTRNWIIAAACLVAVGLIVFAIAAASQGFDWKKLQPADMEEVTYPIEGEFTRIDIDVEVSDIELRIAEDGKARAECLETEKMRHAVTVEDGTLKIVSRSTKTFFGGIFNIGMFRGPKLTVYLTGTEYESLTVKTDTGRLTVPSGFTFPTVYASSDTGSVSFGAIEAGSVKIRLNTGAAALEGVHCDTVDIECDTGSIRLTGVQASSMTLDDDTGSIKLTDVTVAGELKAEADTGSITFDKVGAGSIEASCNTGSIKGTLTTKMSFTASSDTGSVKTPESDPAGGRCVLTTDTGSINVSYAEGVN